MPVNLSLKNVPDDLAERLREQARRNHRSIQGELLSILDTSLKLPSFPVEEIHKRAKELGLQTASNAVVLLREDRDAR